MFKKIKTKIFDYKLKKCQQKAKKMIDKKGDVVICKWCGNLLKKQDADIIYNIEKNEVEFMHEECFYKNEKMGNLEDLEKGGKR